MNKLLNPALSYVCVLGGLSFLFLGRINIGNVALLFFVFLLFIPFSFWLYKRMRPSKVISIIFSVWSVISCACSLTIACRLVIMSETLESDFYPLLLLVTALLSIVVAISNEHAAKSVTMISVFLSVAVLLVIFILSLIDTDFSAPIAQTPDFESFLPICIFALVDVLLIFPMVRTRSPISIVSGGVAAFFTVVLMAFAAVCVLSPELYNALDAPVLKLWQSTYITSFVNRFEIAAISVLYLITALKSGLVLRVATNNSGRKFSSIIMIFVFGLCLLFSFF